MAMAGWDAKQMTDGLAGVMNLAAASGESLGAVSDIVTDTMTAFGMSANESGHFADVLGKGRLDFQYQCWNDGRNLQVRCSAGWRVEL